MMTGVPFSVGELVTPANFLNLSTQLLDSEVLASDTFSHEFDVPASGFTSLRLDLRISHDGAATTFDRARLFLNQDTAANYPGIRHKVDGAGTGATTNMTGFGALECDGSTESRSQWTIFFHNIADTGMQTTFDGRGFVSTGTNAADQQIMFMGGRWSNTDALTHVRVTAPSARNLRAGSYLALYGIP